MVKDQNDECAPEYFRLKSIVDMALNFSAMLRLYTKGAKRELYQHVFDGLEQVFQAKSKEEFTSIHQASVTGALGKYA